MRTVIYRDLFERVHDKSVENKKKHRVQFEEAATVFADPFALEAADFFFPDRFVLIGRSSLSGVLFVVFCERGKRIRIVSARKATAGQRRQYESQEETRSE